MKVEGQLANIAQQRSMTANGHSATSFAEVLASGRSAEGIRSERAFGFSETGLLGAARFGATDGSGVAPPTRNNHQIFSRQQRPPSDTGPAFTERTQTLQPRTTGISKSGGGTYNAAAVSTRALPTLSDGVALGQKVRDFDALAKHRDGPAGKAMFLSPVSRPRHEPRRRKLTIEGTDDGITINIRLEKGDETGIDYLVSQFYPICWQFGVTLNAVQLFGSSKDFAFSMGGDKQCK
jgi:hypothetical protein